MLYNGVLYSLQLMSTGAGSGQFPTETDVGFPQETKGDLPSVTLLTRMPSTCRQSVSRQSPPSLYPSHQSASVFTQSPPLPPVCISLHPVSTTPTSLHQSSPSLYRTRTL
jgi:hypothetical protein